MKILRVAVYDDQPLQAVDYIRKGLSLVEAREIDRGKIWQLQLGGDVVGLEIEASDKVQQMEDFLGARTPAALQSRANIDLVLLDNLWEKSPQVGGTEPFGLNMLDKYKWRGEDLPLLAVFTYHEEHAGGYIDRALSAGAHALIKKTEPVHFINVLRYALERKAWRDQRRLVTAEVSALLGNEKWSLRLCASSIAMRRTLTDLVQVAGLPNATVLIEGAVGSGKTLLAELIHDLSSRSANPFVPVYVNQLNPTTVHGQLFGIAKGAATGVAPMQGILEVAQGGTVFIDELQTVPREVQRTIHNVIERKRFTRVGETQERSCDVRFLVATNKDLDELVKDGKIDEDFASRLRMVALRIPDLKDRREDIPGLASQAIVQWCKENRPQAQVPVLSNDALTLLYSRDFPDNVRGLIHSVWRACLRAGPSPSLLPQHFDDRGASYGEVGFSAADILMLARIGPRDSSSQRKVFDELVASAPRPVEDAKLCKAIEGSEHNLQVVVVRLRQRMLRNGFDIVRDEGTHGYRVIKTMSKTVATL